jgi:hypothetical protein
MATAVGSRSVQNRTADCRKYNFTIGAGYGRTCATQATAFVQEIGGQTPNRDARRK